MGASDLTKLETIQVQRPDGAKLLAEAERTKGEVIAIVIDSDEMYGIAADELASVKGRIKELESQQDNLVRPLNAVITGIRELFKAPLARLKEGETVLKQAMLSYNNRKAEEAAAERRRLEAEAAEQRRQAEAAAAQARRQAEELAAAGRAEEADQLQAEADVKEATAAVIVAPAPTAAPVKVAGVSTRKVWKCELPKTAEDKAKALAYIAANPQFLDLVDFNASACNAMAKAMKANLVIPGLRAYEDQIMGSRSS